MGPKTARLLRLVREAASVLKPVGEGRELLVEDLERCVRDLDGGLYSGVIGVIALSGGMGSPMDNLGGLGPGGDPRVIRARGLLEEAIKIARLIRREVERREARE